MANAAVLLLVVLLVVTPPALLRAADTTHLNMFLHDVVSGSNPTAVQVVKGPAASAGGAIPGFNFGDTYVVDDALTETSSATSPSVGRGQGLYMMSSQSSPVLMVCMNLVLTTGAYNGSTIAVIGSDNTMAKERELSVVGGTGAFQMARGYVLWKTSSMSGADVTVELDVYVTTANGTIDASAPVSPVDGGGKDSGPPGSSTSSSGATLGAAAVYGWVNACVVAVVVALVGGCAW